MKREKQLQSISAEAVREKVAHDEALSLKELAVVSGFGYAIVRSWVNEGLPLLSGKVFPSDFVIWRRRKNGLDRKNAPASDPASASVKQREKTTVGTRPDRRFGKRHYGP